MLRYHFIVMAFLASILFLTNCQKDSEADDGGVPAEQQLRMTEIPEPIVQSAKVGKSSILLVSHNTLDSQYLDFTRKNHQEYARKQNYDYWFRNGVIDKGMFSIPGVERKILRYGLYWQKITAVEDALMLRQTDYSLKYDWVVWIDADAFFTDMDKRLESIIALAKPDDYFIIARDNPQWSCINAGVFLVRNNEQGRKFIAQVRASFEMYKYNSFPEQEAMQDIVYQYTDQRRNEINNGLEYAKRSCQESRIAPNIKVVPQQTMNSFYGSEKPLIKWRPGDFIAHMAGAPDKMVAIKRLFGCMAAQGINLEGCEPGGSWQEPPSN